MAKGRKRGSEALTPTGGEAVDINPSKRALRVVFDAYELVPGRGKGMGIYSYARNLFLSLLDLAGADLVVVVICNEANAADFHHPGVQQIVIPGTAPGKPGRLAWFCGRAALWVRRLGADVYFSPKGFLPRFMKTLSPDVKSVIVVHDLIPLWYAERFPDRFGRLKRLVINRTLIASAKTADRVVAISGTMAADITRRVGRRAGLAVVNNGIPAAEAGPRPYRGPYLFSISSPLPHKNRSTLLAAYRRYREMTPEPLPMIVCGIPDSELPGVIAVNNLDENTLHAYYAHARLFICLSLIEGLGSPVIEALSHDIPVLCSDIPVFREIGRGAVTYVPPEDIERIAAQMIEMSGQTRPVAARPGREALLREYTWQNCARGIADILLSTR